MALKNGSLETTGVFWGQEQVIRLMFNEFQIWPSGHPEFGKDIIIFAYRDEEPMPYDWAAINILTEYGFTVTPVHHSYILGMEYEKVGWLIIGAPGDRDEPVFGQEYIEALPVNVMSFCRNTAINVLGMAEASALVDAGTFRVENKDHEIRLRDYRLREEIVIGSTVPNHEISQVTPGNTVLLSNGTSTTAGGVVGRVVVREENELRRVFWGYYRFDAIQVAGVDLFREIMVMIYRLRSPEILAVAWTGEVDPENLPLVPPAITKVVRD